MVVGVLDYVEKEEAAIITPKATLIMATNPKKNLKNVLVKNRSILIVATAN